MAGHQRTADTPAGGGRADTPVGGGQAGAILRMGMHAYAMGERRMRREPRRGGREDVSTKLKMFYLAGHPNHPRGQHRSGPLEWY